MVRLLWQVVLRLYRALRARCNYTLPYPANTSVSYKYSAFYASALHPFFFLCPRVWHILIFLSGRSMLPTFSFLVIFFTSCSAATRIPYTATNIHRVLLWASSRLLFFPSFRPFPSLLFSPSSFLPFYSHLFCWRKKVPLACWRVRCRCACRLAVPLGGLLLQNGSHGGYGVLQLDGCGSVAPVEFQYH